MGSWMDFVLFCRVSKVLTTYTYTFVVKTQVSVNLQKEMVYIYYIDGSACDVVKKDIWQYKDIILQSAPLSSSFLQYFNHQVTSTFRI